MDSMNIRSTLRKTYLKLLIPALILLAIIYSGKKFNLILVTGIEFLRVLSILSFVLAASFSLALPIFYRSLFASRMKDRKVIDFNEFIDFEKKTIIISMITPYFLVMPLIFDFADFYFGAIILFALYSAYYYYPSKKRMDFERKLFRISE